MQENEVDWEAIYTELLPRIYNFFRYRVGDGPLAEDLTSATFEKAWRARVRYKHKLGKFSTWIFSIARNTAIDYFRTDHQELSINDSHAETDQILVEETVQQRHDFAHLSMLLAELPVRERELIAYKFGAELDNRTIARLMHLSESNVGTILHRSVNKLHTAWEVENER